MAESPSDPTVSVIIATYNWSSVLPYSVGSVLDQDFENFEILVVGDGCTDDSEEVVRSIRDPRVRWHNLSENAGSQSGPNNAGYELARGKYIAYLGHDDLWLPRHLSSLVERIETSGADLVFSIAILVMPDGHRGISGVLAEDRFTERDFVVPSSLLHRRRVFEVIGPWPDPHEERLPVDVEWQRRAVTAEMRFAGVERVTVIKFPSAHRPGSYLEVSSREQEEFRQRIRCDPDFEAQELLAVIKSCRTRPFFVRAPDIFAPPGFFAAKNRGVRGLGEPLPQMLPLPPETDTSMFRIQVLAAPSLVASGGSFSLSVTVRNDSGQPLVSTAPHPVHLSYHWLDDEGREVIEGCRSIIWPILKPAETGRYEVLVDAPEALGRHLLRVSLVQELVRWFKEPVDGMNREVTVEVVEAPVGASSPSRPRDR